jgi:hypothetical protein
VVVNANSDFGKVGEAKIILRKTAARMSIRELHRPVRIMGGADPSGHQFRDAG